jgi:hypothetical protein
LISRYNQDVDDFYVPDITPQEHGLRTDVSSITFDNNRGSRFKIVSDETFHFSASRFSSTDVFAAMHTTDLVPRDNIIINIDHRHRGIGTASWPPIRSHNTASSSAAIALASLL